MRAIIDLEECIKDSPKFRECIEENADDVEVFELKLERLVRLCNGMVEAGKMFINAESAFIIGLREISTYFNDDLTVVNTLQRFCHALQEVTKYQSMLVDQAQRSVVKNINRFVRDDIRQVKESRRHFDKISDELDNVLVRNSQATKSKPNECEEAKNLLTAVRSCFRYTALDYVFQLSKIQSKKRFEVLDTLLSLMHAYTTYFHQGSDLFEDVDPFLKQLDSTLNKLREESVDLEKDLEGRHNLVTQKDFVPTLEKDADVGIRLEGYLFKRTSNAFKTWNRRWFIIQNNQLVYRKKTRGDVLTVMEEDLRLCTVKSAHDLDRRFCFEVLSPSKSHMLQADSEEGCQQWITAMQAGIGAALNQIIEGSKSENEKQSSSSSTDRPCSVNVPVHTPPPKPPRIHSQILSIPGNEVCCDCKSPDPRWASINLGITLCIECSGIHRGLGVQVSKVRSLTLDAWEPEILKVMSALGNEIVNRIYEANVVESVAITATPNCPRDVREAWIKAKYVKKAFVPAPDAVKLVCRVSEDSATEDDVNSFSRNIPKRWSITKLNHRHQAVYDAQDKENGPVTLLRSKHLSIPDLLCNDPVPLDYSPVLPSAGADPVTPQEEVTVEHSNDESNSHDPLKCADIQEMQFTSIQPENIVTASVSDNLDSSEINPNLLLYRASLMHNLPIMAEALARGADVNWSNEDDGGQLSLHQAIRSGSLMACEFLFMNGVKCNSQDKTGKTALHVATELGYTGHVCLLLKRGADQNILDETEKNALAVAINNANADIVTLLRLARLNEEMRKDEFGNPGDETFNEVVRDFSHMASHNPEKLVRPQSTIEPEQT